MATSPATLTRRSACCRSGRSGASGRAGSTATSRPGPAPPRSPRPQHSPTRRHTIRPLSRTKRRSAAKSEGAAPRKPSTTGTGHEDSNTPDDPKRLKSPVLGYDPLYLTRAVATGRENYYLSAVADHGEPPGVWTGLGCPGLGLAVGSQVDNKVMERLYGAFADPRDPAGQATLGRAPSGFAGHDEKIAGRIAGLLAAEPEATAERRDQIIMQALKDQRAAVYFFDATFSVPKSVSLLHASLQVRAQQAREAGRVDEAGEWAGRAQVVWDAIMAGNQA